MQEDITGLGDLLKQKIARFRRLIVHKLTAKEIKVSTIKEKVVGGGVAIANGTAITFTGATTENLIEIPDNLPDALSVNQGVTTYLRFVTTDGFEAVAVLKTFIVLGNITVTGTVDGVDIAARDHAEAHAAAEHSAANIIPNANQAYTGDMGITGALTATSYGGITEANLVDKSAAETIGGAWIFPQAITDNAVVTIDGTANDTEHAVFNAAGLEGLTDTELLAALTGDAGAAFSWNSQALTSVGAIGCGAITSTAGIIAGSNIESDTDDTDDLGTTSKRWGNLHLGHSVVLDPTPDADHESSGITAVFTANENQAVGDVCYIDVNSEMHIADADAIATSYIVGMCADATINANASGNYLLYGFVRDDTWNWTPGAPIFLTVTGTTTNTLSQTAPTGADDCVVIVGVATHADRMLFNPSPQAVVEHTG